MSGFIFDMDGTLIDSMGVWRDFGHRYAKLRGLPGDEDWQKPLKTMSLELGAQYVKEHFALPEPATEILQQWAVLIAQLYQERAVPKPGAVEFLRARRGQPQVVLTANGRPILESVVQGMGFAPWLDATHTAAELGLEKDNPEIYRQTARLIGLQPEECVVFEDTLHAIQAAKQAGCRVVAVADDAYPEDMAAIRAAADYYIHDFAQLRDIPL